MKKTLILTIMAITLFGISSVSFAARYGKSVGSSYMIVEGEIVSVNKTRNLFVIKDKDDGRTYGLSAFRSDIASLNQGDHVTVTVPRPGNLASKIKK